jgi:hypothetical protein
MYLRGLGVYYLKNGQPASVLYVGDMMSFNVPGYSQVWLEQTQNGNPQYSGPFSLPMTPYTLLPQDQGTFAASVYTLTPGNTRGQPIGTDSIQVQARPAAPPPPIPVSLPPIIQQTPAPGFMPPSGAPSGGGRLPTGVATPSAGGGTTVVALPTYTPGYEEAPAPEVEQAGMDTTTMLLLGGLILGFMFMGKRS